MTNKSPWPVPPALLAAVNRPIESASGLPNSVYDDDASFHFERDRLFARTWVAITFASDLPGPGHVLPVEFMGLPLLAVRNRSGELRVFHNVCSHRGMQLVSEEKTTRGMIRCPYHSWCYDLDGALQNTPHIGGVDCHAVDGFDKRQHGLRPVRSATWLGIVFVNLDGDAPAFEEFIAPLVQRWEAFVGAEGLDAACAATNGSSLEFDVQCNWKLAVENYCEAYHLPWVHPALNRYSPLDEHYSIVVDENMSGQGSYNYNLAEDSGPRLPRFQNWPSAKIRQAEYISLYPNVLLGLQADHVFVVILEPRTQRRTLERLQLGFIGDAAVNDEHAVCRQIVLDSWKVVFSEDIFAVEGMQRGRRSPGFSGGVFSPVLDGPTHHFHQWVAKHYAAAG